MAAAGDEAEKGRLLEEEDPLQGNLLSKIDAPNGDSSPEKVTGLPRSQVPWILSAAISILSTRYILITQHFHFPVILVVWQAATAILLLLSYSRIKRTIFRSEDLSSQEEIPLNLRALFSLIVAAVALPVTNQGLLHFTNVASLAMFSIHTVSVLELLRLLSTVLWTPLVKKTRPKALILIYLILAGLCVFISYGILSRDYRRSSRGDRSLIVASYLTALAQLALTSSSRRDTRDQRIPVRHFQLAFTGFVFVFGLVWYFPYEGPYTSLQLPNFFILLLNLLSSGIAIVTGGSLIMPLSLSDAQEAEDHNQFSHSLRQRVISCFSVAALVAIMSLQLPTRGYVNALQLALYTTAFLILFTGGLSYGQKTSLGGIFRLNNINRTVTILAVLCWTAYVPLNFSEYPFTPALPVSHASIDRQYRTAARLDIVVAHFTEPASDIAKLVTAVASAPTMKRFNPHVYIYSKNNRLDLVDFREKLQDAFKADPRNQKRFSTMVDKVRKQTAYPPMELEKMVNTGREAATYFHHIAARWHKLAQHTLFTQASSHDLDEVVERLQYFVPGPPIAPLPKRADPVARTASQSLSPGKITEIFHSFDVGNLRSFTFKADSPELPAPPTKLSKRAAPVRPIATGFLPLGFTTEVCDCHRCSDTWGWYDTSPLIAKAFSTVYGLPKPQCGNVLLVYKGMFIVSAQRIRGIDRMAYVEYRNALNLEDRWEHSREYLENFTGHGGVNAADGATANPMLLKSSDSVKDAGAAMRLGRPSGTTSHRWGEKDSLERPWFGYTMERMWAILFQCSDMGIAWKCPTLRGKWRASIHGVNGGSELGDCQCMDTIRPPDND